MILTKWPSYVYECELLIEDRSSTLIVLEPINGINGLPILLANLNLDQGLINHRKRLLQLAEGLTLMKSLPCENTIVTRNFDYTAAFSREELEVIKGKGFKESYVTRDNPSLQDQLNIQLTLPETDRHWAFEDLIAFGACLGP